MFLVDFSTSPIPLNEGILHRQMDKCSVTLAKNMDVQLVKFNMQNMFQFYFHYDRLLEYEQGLHGSHRKGVHTFPMLGQHVGCFTTSFYIYIRHSQANPRWVYQTFNKSPVLTHINNQSSSKPTLVGFIRTSITTHALISTITTIFHITQQTTL